MMYLSFVEETCTGTGQTQALQGVTIANRPRFTDGLVDGALIKYIIEDSGGIIFVAGVGTYVSATDDILRNDRLNWNGSVLDKNPSTNITLSGGTHTIRCDVIARDVSVGNYNDHDWAAAGSTVDGLWPNSIVQGASGKGRGNNDAPFILTYQPYSQIIVKLGIDITTADAGATNTLAAIYSAKEDFSVGDLLVSTGDLSGASTGEILETLSAPLFQPSGFYYYTTKSDSSTLRTTGATVDRFTSPIGLRRGAKTILLRRAIVGAYPATVSETGWTGENNGFSSPIFETA